MFALDADTGTVRPGWPVDVDAKARVGTLAFDSSVQNQRGALALLNGTLYVPTADSAATAARITAGSWESQPRTRAR